MQHNIDEDTRKLEGIMQPLRHFATALLPAGVAQYDIEIGRNQERIRFLNRMKDMLEQRDEWTDKIEEIDSAIRDLEISLAQKSNVFSLDRAAIKLGEGMNTYLNALNSVRQDLWLLGPVDVELKENRFDFRIGGDHWTAKLGGTLTLYFMIAYHYGLLNLSSDPDFCYPGLLILDFPATMGSGQTATRVADAEAYSIEPFKALVSTKDVQIIAAGASFEGLKDANRIELTNVWI